MRNTTDRIVESPRALNLVPMVNELLWDQYVIAARMFPGVVEDGLAGAASSRHLCSRLHHQQVKRPRRCPLLDDLKSCRSIP